jgi:hypothetical protein
VSRVLVACEFSGIVRDAFRARGHDAWSCDLLPSEKPGPHMQCDLMTLFYPHAAPAQWDMMIAHPPCTFLTNSSVRWLYLDGKKENGRDRQRWEDMYKAAHFYRTLRDVPIKRKCLENPRAMIGHAKKIIDPGHVQTIHPWQFGHGEVKATGLELINLPDLIPTNIVDGRHARVHREPPGHDRWKSRSRTLQGIADAMAEQWGSL